MEHLQELYSARIILSELLACLKCVKEGGNFCCKLFDTFSALSASIIYVVGLCFESTYIVKPFRSRIVNSERYIVGKRFRPRTPMMIKLIVRSPLSSLTFYPSVSISSIKQLFDFACSLLLLL
jgi:hypothetical protein